MRLVCWGGGRGLDTDWGLSTTLTMVYPHLPASRTHPHLHRHGISTACVAGSSALD